MFAPPPIEGLWQPLKAELSGESAPEMVITHTTLTLRSGRYTVRFDGEVADQGSYVLAPGAPHAVLTLTGEKGANSGKKIPAIFQLVGDRLRVCYGLDGELPEQFSTTSAQRFYLVTYRRTSA